MMPFTKELASEILTGLEAEIFEPFADEPARSEEFQDWVDAVFELADEHSPAMVLATADFVSQQSAHLLTHELKDYVQEHYRGCGSREGDVLKEHVEGAELGDLYEMFEALNKAHAVDWFDWQGYAVSSQSPMSSLHFCTVPATGAGSDSVFLFEEN